MRKIPLVDADGYVYSCDFAFIHPSYDARKHCFAWALSSYARNSTEYSHWAMLRVDLCGTSPVNTLAWYKEGQYPSEPVFVPRPGADAEDDGVVLAQVVDGTRAGGPTTCVVVVDARTMTELGRACLPDGDATPYTQHGRWFAGGHS